MSTFAKEPEESAVVIIQIMHQFVGITRTSRKRSKTHGRISIAAVAQHDSSNKI